MTQGSPNQGIETLSALRDRRIAFTTPIPYGKVLRHHLHAAGAQAFWVPTLNIQRSDRTRNALKQTLRGTLTQLSGIAFTSRNGIQAVAEVLTQAFPELPELKRPFYLAALGRDQELLSSLSSLWQHPNRRHIVPKISTPQALADCLGEGRNRTILYPVPEVIGLQEPDVVPNFLTALNQSGWRSLRINAYETRWAGPKCASPFLSQSNHLIDALIFTSTAEIEGLLKSFETFGVKPDQALKSIVLAAHGPVTAQGAQSLGIKIPVISHDSSSFLGVLKALQGHWHGLKQSTRKTQKG